jgi:hypothetical protein
MEPVRFIALIIGQLNAAGGEGMSDLLIPEQDIRFSARHAGQYILVSAKRLSAKEMLLYY